LGEAAGAPAPDSAQLRHLAGEVLDTLCTATPSLASHTAIGLGHKAIRTLGR